MRVLPPRHMGSALPFPPRATSLTSDQEGLRRHSYRLKSVALRSLQLSQVSGILYHVFSRVLC